MKAALTFVLSLAMCAGSCCVLAQDSAGVQSSASIYANPIPNRFRSFPLDSKYGMLTLKSTQQAFVNGNEYKVSPGLRVFNAQNFMVLSNQIMGVEFKAAYRLDTGGWIQEIWVLTPGEIAANEDTFQGGLAFKLWWR